MRLIQDGEVRERLNFLDAIKEIERVLDAQAKGAFNSPARHYEGNAGGDLAFTIGGDARQGTFGFRVYPRYRAAGENSQFTAVYDAASGTLEGLVFGDYLGAVRTGAIGGVAIKRMAPQEIECLALIGTGLQAETQLLAACAVREITEVRIYSRDPKKREAFCERMSTLVSASLRPMTSPEEALDGASVAITATNSKNPICDAKDFADVRHLNAIGPKFSRANELPDELYQTMDVMVSDSRAQLEDYDVPQALRTAPAFAGLQELSAIAGPEHESKKSLFLSVGLAGTEPCIARLLLGD